MGLFLKYFKQTHELHSVPYNVHTYIYIYDSL
jgi:hypothetical protein